MWSHARRCGGCNPKAFSSWAVKLGWSETGDGPAGAALATSPASAAETNSVWSGECGGITSGPPKMNCRRASVDPIVA